MTSIFDKLIQANEERKQAEAAAREKAVVEFGQMVESAANEQFNSEFVELANYGEYEVLRSEDNSFRFLWTLSVAECDQYQLSPMLACTHWLNPGRTLESLKWHLGVNAEGYRQTWKSVNTLHEMITTAREEYPKWKEWEMAERVNLILVASSLRNDPYCHFLRYDNNKNLETARELLVNLLEADPNNAEKYNGWMELWLKTSEESKARQAEETKQKELMESHHANILAYMQECHRVHEENRLIADKYQKEVLDKPVTIYELVYALVAWDSEDKYLDTQKTYVKNMGTKDGIFPHLNGDMVKYYHPVACKRVDAVASQSGSFTDWMTITGVGGEIQLGWITGTTDKETIMDALKERGWQDDPAEPMAPDGLDSANAQEARINAITQFWRDTEEDSREEPPF